MSRHLNVPLLLRIAGYVAPAMIACSIVVLSMKLGPDASWDLKNYHIYDAFAYARKPFLFDIIPAQLQTFNCPYVDLIPFWLRMRLNAWPNALDALLGLPEAFAVVIVWFIGRRVVPQSGLATHLSLALAVLFGATGAAGLPTIGSSMSEMPSALFALMGLLLLLGRRAATGDIVIAGTLFGISVALKLTTATLCVAAFLAVLASGSWPLRRSLPHWASFGLGIVTGALAIGGSWWLHLWRRTGNPVFPYFNQLFASPLYGRTNIADTRFLPRTVFQAIAYPFTWGFSPSQNVSELPLRDPRFAMAYVAMIAWCVMLARRSTRQLVSPQATLLIVFFGSAFVLWEVQFSIFRYLAPLELLSGFIVLLALRPLRQTSEWLPPLGMAGLLAAAACLTVYPDWGRASPAMTAASVTAPRLPSDATVLLLSSDPMSYVAAFLPATVRLIGVNNNMVHPGMRNGLENTIEQTVRRTHSPLYGLDVAGSGTSSDADVLSFYGLRRGECQAIRTNLEQDGLRICRLTRSPATAELHGP